MVEEGTTRFFGGSSSDQMFASPLYEVLEWYRYPTKKTLNAHFFWFSFPSFLTASFVLPPQQHKTKPRLREPKGERKRERRPSSSTAQQKTRSTSTTGTSHRAAPDLPELPELQQLLYWGKAKRTSINYFFPRGEQADCTGQGHSITS